MSSETVSSAILIKFETRSNRVKGLSFHPKRPWILASLHTGAIQLWDYRMGTLIERFEEHDGPVRGVDFHDNQPLFCSGGDDQKVKVWDYKLRRCIFTLVGHIDYVRTVQFHKRLPWIVSASDDGTLRIWNWQGRSCMSVLTGHNHYVMSAAFHPRRDLVVSASLDQTLRLWDLYGLKSQTKTSTFAGNVTQDIFGGSDVQVKHILEGHERGVNYAAFHPTLPLIVSGSDDRSVRVWRVEEVRAYEIEQFRGHTSNVSSVMYFKDLIVSNSEDRSIRVWDVKLRSTIHISKRDTDRFWILAVHPEKNLIAAGHDTGMIVFKLERERPAMQLCGDTLYWVKQSSGDRQLRAYNFDTKTETPVVTLSHRQTHPPHTLSYCKEENMAVFSYAQDGGSFELYPLGNSNGEVRRGFYTSSVFFQRNKFAVLDKNRQIIIKNTQNNILAVLPAVHNADEIFWAPNNQLLLKADDKVYMFDPHQKKVVAQANATGVKYVVWSPEGRDAKVAFISKHAINVFTKKGLKPVCSVHENTPRMKSACFDEKAVVLLYTTLNHLKYCLQNGDTGTIKTLDAPIYLVKLVGDEVSYVDREGNFCTMKIDSSEYQFKLALLDRRWNDVRRIVKGTRIYGQAWVSYLQQRGFPEVAMYFVRDPKVRFKLAVECGNLDDALECAEQLKDEASWLKLSETAMLSGDVKLATTCLNKAASTATHQKLSFLNFLMGDNEKASEYADLARDDTNGRFQMALFTGDADMRVKLLEEAGQFTLAQQVAARNGKKEKAEALVQKAMKSVQDVMKIDPPEDEDDDTEDLAAARQTLELRGQEASFATANKLMEALEGAAASLELPSRTAVSTNWPLYRLEGNKVEALLADGGAIDDMPAADAGGDAWGGDGDLDDVDMGMGGDEGWEGGGLDDGMDDMDMGDGGGWGDDADDLIAITPEDIIKGKGDKDIVMPHAGLAQPTLWCNQSKNPVDHIAAGSFESAMKLMNSTYGVKNFAPLKSYFLKCFAAATATAPMAYMLPSQLHYLNRQDEKLPATAVTLQMLADKCKEGGHYATGGKFLEARNAFQVVLQMNLFLHVKDDAQKAERANLVKKAREYASAFSLQLARGDITNPARSSEMAAYFTHFSLDHNHASLVLKFAMLETYKRGYFQTSGSIARRLLDFNPDPKLTAQAKKAVTMAEQKTDATQLNYDSRNPFEVCVKSWTPMYMGSATPLRCKTCGAPAGSDHAGEVCPVCGVGSFEAGNGPQWN